MKRALCSDTNAMTSVAYKTLQGSELEDSDNFIAVMTFVDGVLSLF